MALSAMEAMGRKIRMQDLFGRIQAEERVRVSPEPGDRPKPQLVKENKEPLEDYTELAKALDFMPAQLLQTLLLNFMSLHHIPRFNYDQVYHYLARIAERENKIWIWRPLRERDKTDKFHIFGGIGGHGDYENDSTHRRYDKAVPIHILKQVKTIQDEFGDQVGFFVSDYTVPVPDPFIMVTAAGVENIIFGVWDEPAFFAKEVAE